MNAPAEVVRASTTERDSTIERIDTRIVSVPLPEPAKLMLEAHVPMYSPLSWA